MDVQSATTYAIVHIGNSITFKTVFDIICLEGRQFSPLYEEPELV